MGAALFGIFPLQQLFDDDVVPLAAGKLYSYMAGTSTPQATYTDSDLTTPHENPITLDAAGRPPLPIYVLPAGYKWVLTNADDEVLQTLDNWSDPGWIFAENFGYEQSQGAKDQTSGYQVLVTDRLVTMDSTGGPNPCLVYLPAASQYTSQLVIKNLGTVPLSIVPNGADTIDTLASAIGVPAASSPVFPAGTFVSDNVSGWYIIGSHGAT